MIVRLQRNLGLYMDITADFFSIIHTLDNEMTSPFPRTSAMQTHTSFSFIRLDSVYTQQNGNMQSIHINIIHSGSTKMMISTYMSR